MADHLSQLESGIDPVYSTWTARELDRMLPESLDPDMERLRDEFPQHRSVELATLWSSQEELREALGQCHHRRYLWYKDGRALSLLRRTRQTARSHRPLQGLLSLASTGYYLRQLCRPWMPL